MGLLRIFLITVCAFAVGAFSFSTAIRGQSIQEPPAEARSERVAAATIRGVVRDSLNRTVSGAKVCLQSDGADPLTVYTDSEGDYSFHGVRRGNYFVHVETEGYVSTNSPPFVLSGEESKTVDLVLQSAKVDAPIKSTGSPPEFFDEPHFTVAGVTDTTGLGGHGSDTIVRNREALARAAVSLGKDRPGTTRVESSGATEISLREAVKQMPQNSEANFRLGKFLVDEARPREALTFLERAAQSNPSDGNNSYELAIAYVNADDFARARERLRALLVPRDKPLQEDAALHHLLAEADEGLGDSLEAVREYQRAAQLNPSENNLFDWGAELLLHHAAEPAIEVFSEGNLAFPRSVRMLAALGAAWYSEGSYEKAVKRLCEASDLNQEDPSPYLFMGKIQATETAPSPAIEERLARFARFQPQNPWANYYYAVSLLKRLNLSGNIADAAGVESLLQSAIRIDPNFGAAYLQLGVLYSERKDLSNAIASLQKAIEANPQLEEAHYRLAQLYLHAGENEKAHAELQVYQRIAKERTEETKRQRHEVQQFVYELRDGTPGSQPR
jgi:tetratricopeptide (TPR) repeat protein